MTFRGALSATELLLFVGLAVTLAIWASASAFVIVNRLLHDHRERRMMEIARALTEPTIAALPPLERSPPIRRILSRKSRRAVYRMVASTDFPDWVAEICAAYCIDKWGLRRMMLDAATPRRRSKWRRVSALFALGQMRATGIHDLLETAVFDPDPEVADAAAMILHRLGDRRAAEGLIAAVRARSYAPSRVTTQLDQFPLPIDDLLRPLLADPLPHVRYWGATLLIRYAGADGLALEIAALADDAHAPVRKAALETLGAISTPVAVAAAQQFLGDSIAYVRSTAIRSLAQHATPIGDPVVSRALAVRIAPALGDSAWEVRLAAKEALVALGPHVWPEAAAQLRSGDEFARNGAAEVLQNLGLLDVLMEEFGKGSHPSTELVDVLTRAFQEGGHAMVTAAITRLKPESATAVENLLTRLRLTATAAT